MKKLLVIAASLFVVAGMIFGFSNLRDMGENVIDDARQAARDAVPISTKIRSLEKKIERLGPQIKDAQRIVATQDVRVDKLQKEIEQREVVLAKQWKGIEQMRLAMDAKDGKQFVTVDGHEYEKKNLASTLKQKWETHKAAEDAVTQKKALLKSRQSVLDANRQAYDNLVNAEEKLGLMVEQLKARQESIKAKQIEKMQTIDDSPTGDVMKLYEEIDEQLSVEEKLIEMDGDHTPDSVKVEESAGTDSLLEEIDAKRAKQADEGKGTDLININ